MNQDQLEHASPQRIVIVGAGRWGMNYVRELSQRGVLAGVVDPYLSPAAGDQLDAGRIPIFGSIADALATVDFDGAIISSPASEHADGAREMLQASKHVLVEKPVAFNTESLDSLYELATGNGVRLMSGHLLQHHPAVIELVRLVRSGLLGKVRSISSTRTSMGSVRRQENVVWSFAPHDVGLVLDLLETEPTDISITAVSVHNQVDQASLQLRLGEAQVHIYVSWLCNVKQQLLTITGDLGVATFDDCAPWDEKLRVTTYELSYDDQTRGRSAVPLSVCDHSTPLVQESPLSRQVDAFIECMNSPTPLSIRDEWLTRSIVRILEKSLAVDK